MNEGFSYTELSFGFTDENVFPHDAYIIFLVVTVSSPLCFKTAQVENFKHKAVKIPFSICITLKQLTVYHR